MREISSYTKTGPAIALWNIFEDASSLNSDVDCYVIIIKLLDFVLKLRWEPES
jgi:hypothetical protein